MGERTELIADELSFIMPRIARAMTSSFMHHIELPPAQLFTILEIEERSVCRVSQLCAALRISAPTVTGILDRLERSGYVVREHDSKDRRAVNVLLTRLGKQTAVKIRKGIKARWGQILAQLTPTEARQYLRIVKKIQEQIYKLNP